MDIGLLLRAMVPMSVRRAVLNNVLARVSGCVLFIAIILTGPLRALLIRVVTRPKLVPMEWLDAACLRHSYLCNLCLRRSVSENMARRLLVRNRTSVSARSMLLRRRVATLVCLLLCLPSVCLAFKLCISATTYGITVSNMLISSVKLVMSTANAVRCVDRTTCMRAVTQTVHVMKTIVTLLSTAYNRLLPVPNCS